MCNPDDGLSGGDSGDSAGDDTYAQRSMRFKTRVMPTCVTSSAPDLTFVRRGHHETRTHAASRSGTSGPVLCCLDLSAIHGSMAFQVASGIEKRNRADVSWFLCRARPLSAAGCQKAILASLADCLRGVVKPGSCLRDDHSNRGSVEPRDSP